MTGDPAVLVLHAPGPDRSGAGWHDALVQAGWAAPVLAPDLPGHGAQPPPMGGNYELADAAFAALAALREHPGGTDRPLVVGVGASGWSAQVLALGGRACGLVLVDGLGGPFAEPRELIGAGAAWLRAIANDPDAAGPAPSGVTDPRLTHGVPPHGSRRLAERAAAATPVPTLLVETPSSPLAEEEVRRLAGLFGAGADVVAAPGSAAGVAERVVAWAHRRDLTV